ncbi:MAG: hypothetical protein CVU05_12060 [Bacteroidetes bacterium HGW-Bacteroidetes-21]|jgi:hypothetical protein|nr:MAG: hypothetical protein CVU05_12060 [Bacteroidetes bacterium HGW-Bacteroidetes-21]
MRNIIVCISLLSLIISCSPTKRITNGSNQNNSSVVTDELGSSFKNAIIIKEETETTGVDAEYAWIKKNYPGYKTIQQALKKDNNKYYDIIDIKTAQGEKKSIYFDITNFFGKF